MPKAHPSALRLVITSVLVAVVGLASTGCSCAKPLCPPGAVCFGPGADYFGSPSGYDAGSGEISSEAPMDDAGDAAPDVLTTIDAAVDSYVVMPAEADAGPLPTPTVLDMAAGCEILGVTDDGYVVYSTSDAVKAAPIAGGTAVALAGVGNAIVVHDVVFVWTGDDDPQGGVASLSVWTSTFAAPYPLSTSSLFGVAAASADSSFIVYAGGASADGSATSLFAARMSALDSPTMLAAGLDTANPACSPVIAFSGSVVEHGGVLGPANNEYAVALSCSSRSSFETVTSYLSGTWGGAILSPSVAGLESSSDSRVAPLSLDRDGKLVALGLSNGSLELSPLSGGSPVAIAPAGTLATRPQSMANLAFSDFGGPFFGNAASYAVLGQTNVYLSQDDSFVLFVTAGGELLTSPTNVSQPTTLVLSGVGFLDAISSDEAWALYDHGTYPTLDLLLASTRPGGTSSILSHGRIALTGVAFTADSKFAIFMSCGEAEAPSGALMAVSVTDPEALIPLASNAVSTNGLSPSDAPLGGSKLSFVDNFDPTQGEAGSVDIHVIDLAVTVASTTLVRGADPMYAVSFDKTRLLYTISRGGSADGIYSVLVP